jgi:hypothetical protein
MRPVYRNIFTRRLWLFEHPLRIHKALLYKIGDRGANQFLLFGNNLIFAKTSGFLGLLADLALLLAPIYT